jgi:hypothetical protein
VIERVFPTCVQGMAELECCLQEQQTGMQGELKK